MLDRLAELGVKLSIDDYGTGYSSLSYIMRLPVQELKIDRSFISRMTSDPEISTIVRSTIDLGHNLGLKVVAEGVEELAAWNMLRTLGCDDAQGFFMSHPLRARRCSSTGFARTTACSNARARPGCAKPHSAGAETRRQILDEFFHAHRREAAAVQRARTQRLQRRDVRSASDIPCGPTARIPDSGRRDRA